MSRRRSREGLPSGVPAAAQGWSRRQFMENTARAGVGLAAMSLLGGWERGARADDSVWAANGAERVVGRPAVVRNADGLLTFFLRNEDNALYFNHQKGANGADGWGDWNSYEEAFLTASPSVGLASNGDIVALLVAKDRRARVAVRRGDTWVQEFPKLANFTTYTVEGEPTVVRLGSGELAVFLRTTGNQLWYNRMTKPDPLTWGGWYSGYYYGSSNINGIATDDGKTILVARDSTNKLVVATVQANGSWAWKDNLSDAFLGDPAVAKHSDGRVEIFVIGGDGKLQRRTQEDVGKEFAGTDGWKVEEGLITKGNVAVAVNANKKISVFARADDGQIYHKPQKEADGDFDDWAILESGEIKFNADPVVAAHDDGRLELIARGNDGKLYSTRQDGPNGSFKAPG